MADRTKIEWTDSTWNPIRARNLKTGKVGWHCEHASPGCAHCYAESFNAQRLGTRLLFKPGHRADVEIFLDETMLLKPLRWKRPRMIFVCSMTDLFADFVPDEMIDQVFAVAAASPQHTLQILTKRGARMRQYLSDPDLPIRVARAWCRVGRNLRDGHIGWSRLCWNARGMDSVPRYWPLPNLWLGVSAEDQCRADERRDDLRHLADIGWTTFVSYEPALGPVNWTGWEFLSWLIAGGESGREARAAHPAWFRTARDFSAANNVAFFFKQWGEWHPSTEEAARLNSRSGWRSVQSSVGRIPKGEELYESAGAAFVARIGKKAAGRLLDGVEHNGMPKPAHALTSQPRVLADA